MIGTQKSQLSLLDSAFNTRTKRSRADKLLKKIDTFVEWKNLESICNGMYKDSKRGRPSLPIIVALKCLVLQYLYNLSDPALEDALIDRLSFQRFLGISFDSEIPDFTTIWRFRERLIKADLLDEIFTSILEQLDKRNLILRKGTLVDATLVQAARKKIKNKRAGESAGTKESQKDYDASGTQKGGTYYYGYKGHIATDEGSNIIRRRRFTTASVHDSKEFNNLVCGDERSVFADKAYADNKVKRNMREKGIYYGIMDKGRRGRPKLSTKQKKTNTWKKKVRNAVERPFAHFKKHMGFRSVRYVNLQRNELHFTFLCMIHNIRRGIALTAPGS
jgi:IS5 family transposase